MARIQLALGFDAQPEIVESHSDAWYTPPDLLERARLTFGGKIDTDPCWHPQSHVEAAQRYTAADDGLSKPWLGNVWLNPPYSDPLPFVRRLADHCDEHRAEGIALVKHDHTTRWWDVIDRRAAAVCYLRDRVRFHRPTPDGAIATCAAPFPSSVAYFGFHAQGFDRWWRDLGRVVVF